MSNYYSPYGTLDQVYRDYGSATTYYQNVQDKINHHYTMQKQYKDDLERQRRRDAELAKLRREELQLREKLRKLEMTAAKEESKNAEPVVDKVCNICMERQISAAFSCGHTLCYCCGLEIKERQNKCPFCNQRDVEVIRLYT